MTRTTFVLLLRQRSCKADHFRAAPHAANGDSFAAPHAASDDLLAAPHAASDELYAAPHAASREHFAARRVVVDVVPYRMLPERWASVRLVVPAVSGLLAVPEPRHPTALAGG
jgi:hypothetical protein